MEKYLFSCSNPYQVMLAALLKLQCLKSGDVADLIVTDTFNGYEKITEKIKKTGFFDNVYNIKVKEVIVTSNLESKLKKVNQYLFFERKIKNCLGEIHVYDKFFFNNEDIYIFNMITYLKEKNRKCKICRYEEGYSSYTNIESSSPRSKKIINFRNYLIGNKVSLEWDEFYVFEPEMLMKKYDVLVRRIDRSYVNKASYCNFIKRVFETDKIVNDYQRKYIIFEESFVNDGYEVDDLELYERIVELIGPNNVTVKLHPRSSTNRFSKMGVDVKIPDGVPWEAIVLSSQMKDVTLIALGSGSVINSRLLLGANTRAFLLYKCLKKKPPAFDSKFEKFIEKFSYKYKEGVIVPENMEKAIEAINIDGAEVLV